MSASASASACSLGLSWGCLGCDGLLDCSIVRLLGLEGVFDCWEGDAVDGDGAWVEVAEEGVFAVELFDQSVSPVRGGFCVPSSPPCFESGRCIKQAI